MYTLYIMCGPPGSGKTTYAKRFLSHCTYISRDNIRFKLLEEGQGYFDNEDKVFKEFISSIGRALLFNNVVADATHLNIFSRNKLIHGLEYYYRNRQMEPSFSIVYVIMDTPLHTCLERNSKRQGNECVPTAALKDMFNKFTCPTLTESSRCIAQQIIRVKEEE